jgi:hypothetical protein
MDWRIHPEGYYWCRVEGFHFEIGEWHHGTWLLKVWTKAKPSSDWHTCESLEDAFALAQSMASPSVVGT